jgi:hypothetical protein
MEEKPPYCLPHEATQEYADKPASEKPASKKNKKSDL